MTERERLPERAAANDDRLPAVPGFVTLRGEDVDGSRRRISTAGDEWLAPEAGDGGDTVVIEVGRLARRHPGGVTLSPRAFHTVRLYLAHRLARRSPHTVRGEAEALRRFCGCPAGRDASRPELAFDWSGYTPAVARAFLEIGMTTAQRGNDVSRLRRFYRWGVAKQYPDFSPDVYRALRKVSGPANVKGAAVRHRDPIRGPFDARELKTLREAAGDARVDLRDRVVLMLFLEWGTNPNQVTRLRNRDFHAYPAEAPRDYKLDFPRNKKRTARRVTKQRPVSTRLGAALRSLQQGGADDPLLHWLDPGDRKRSLTRGLRRAARAAQILSARTGQALRVSPRRFRYSLATEAAGQGATDAQLRDLLDHSDTQNVGVYTAFTPGHLKRVAEATDAELAGVVGDFLGVIIADASAPVFPGVPRQLIEGSVDHLPDVEIDVGGVGLCGQDARKEGLCALMQPLACYKCKKFAAFRLGPHREILAALEHARTRLQEHADARIVVQLDEVLVALRQLVAQLDEEEAAAAASGQAVPVVQISRQRRQTYRTRGRGAPAAGEAA